MPYVAPLGLPSVPDLASATLQQVETHGWVREFAHSPVTADERPGCIIQLTYRAARWDSLKAALDDDDRQMIRNRMREMFAAMGLPTLDLVGATDYVAAVTTWNDTKATLEEVKRRLRVVADGGTCEPVAS